MRGMNRGRFPLLSTLIVFMAFMAGGTGAHAATAKANTLDVIKECIEEPVFSGTACIYEANREAEKTIVLVHGLNGRALNDWQHQIPVLAEQFHVLTFDLPGFGDSNKDVANYSPREYAHFIRYVIEHYAHSKIILVGHSMGGAISLRYTSMYPENIEKLVLVDVAGVLHRMAYARQLAQGWVASNASDDSRFLSLVDRMANKLLSKVEPITGPVAEFMARQVLKRELLDVNPSVISALTLVNEDLSDAFEKVTMPTLIVWGQNDRVAPVRTLQMLLQHLPDARYAVVEGAAHVPMNEQPEKFNKLFYTFVDGDDAQVGLAADSGSDRELYRELSRESECYKETGMLFEGYYKKVTINGCSEIVVRNARIDKLVINSSKVQIENSDIQSEGTAMEVKGSDLVITASQISGDVAIRTSGSRLDLAAVQLKGARYAVQAERGSSLVFSTSSIDSSRGSRSVHEFVKVDRRHPL